MTVESYDAETLADPRVRVLLERYAALTGARLDEIDRDLVELVLPPAEQAFFATDRGREARLIRLALSLYALEHHPDAEMAVVGSGFFECLVEAIRHRGWRYCHGVVPPDGPASAGAPKLTVPIANGQVESASSRVSLHRVGRLLARVMVRAGAETEEHLVSGALFDLGAGVPVPPPIAELCEGLVAGDVKALALDAVPAAAPRSSALPETSLGRMVEDLETRMSDVIQRRKAGAAQSLRAELARLDRYYDELLSQDFGAGASRRAAIEREREKRHAEEERRHAVRVTVHPMQLEEWLLLTQRAEWVCLSETGHRGTVVAQRYASGGDEWSIACARCGTAPRSIVVCYESHAACADCGSICSVCGDGFCHDHGIAACHVDGAPACAQHVARCPSCRREHCTAHQGVCADTEHVACSSCLAPCAVCGRVICESHATESWEDAPLGSRRLCPVCVVYCEGKTSEPVGRDEAVRCASCENFVCREHQSECVVDRAVHCSKHLRRSDHSRRLVCESHRGACYQEPAAILASDEVFSCVQCGGSVCGRHSDICVGHGQRFCHSHLEPLLDTKGEFGCIEHHSVCHVDGGSFSLGATSPCPICTKATCRTHLPRCKWCGRRVCKVELGSERRCVTCGKLSDATDIPDDLLAASLAANGGQSVRARAWRVGRDAGHRVVEADLGWTRRIVFTVAHGDLRPSSVMRHSLFGARRVG